MAISDGDRRNNRRTRRRFQKTLELQSRRRIDSAVTALEYQTTFGIGQRVLTIVTGYGRCFFAFIPLPITVSISEDCRPFDITVNRMAAEEIVSAVNRNRDVLNRAVCRLH